MQASDGLDRAYRRLQEDRDAMAGLDTLYEEIEKREWLEELNSFSLWLLAPQRQSLKVAFAALRENLIAAIGDQVADILDNNTPDGAQELLRKKVLLPPQVREVARDAHRAILGGVGQRLKRQ